MLPSSGLRKHWQAWPTCKRLDRSTPASRALPTPLNVLPAPCNPTHTTATLPPCCPAACKYGSYKEYEGNHACTKCPYPQITFKGEWGPGLSLGARSTGPHCTSAG